jgi:hypothetical protein
MTRITFIARPLWGAEKNAFVSNTSLNVGT